MQTLEQILAEIHQSRAATLDGRELSRLCAFLPVQRWPEVGFRYAGPEGAKPPAAKAWTRENILEQLRADVAFGFEKALDQRGISSHSQYECVKLWLRVLEDPLCQMTDYAEYGLPLFKAVAVKYGFDNPIGEDTGSEAKYAMEAEHAR